MLPTAVRKSRGADGPAGRGAGRSTNGGADHSADWNTNPYGTQAQVDWFSTKSAIRPPRYAKGGPKSSQAWAATVSSNCTTRTQLLGSISVILSRLLTRTRHSGHSLYAYMRACVRACSCVQAGMHVRARACVYACRQTGGRGKRAGGRAVAYGRMCTGRCVRKPAFLPACWPACLFAAALRYPTSRLGCCALPYRTMCCCHAVPCLAVAWIGPRDPGSDCRGRD